MAETCFSFLLIKSLARFINNEKQHFVRVKSPNTAAQYFEIVIKLQP
jgi:hypothetical protein